MGLKITPITFVAGTIAKSSDVNSNFQAIINASEFNGSWDSTNNANVSLTNEDVIVRNTSVMRLRPSNGNPDRGLALSTRKSGGIQDGIYLDPSGVVHFISEPVDNHGNDIEGMAYFSGNGAGVYNHNYAGGVTPNYVAIAPSSETTPSWSCHSIGSSTFDLDMSTNTSFNGIAVQV